MKFEEYQALSEDQRLAARVDALLARQSDSSKSKSSSVRLSALGGMRDSLAAFFLSGEVHHALFPRDAPHSDDLDAADEDEAADEE